MPDLLKTRFMTAFSVRDDAESSELPSSSAITNPNQRINCSFSVGETCGVRHCEVFRCWSESVGRFLSVAFLVIELFTKIEQTKRR